jgi:four helix bundle protein
MTTRASGAVELQARLTGFAAVIISLVSKLPQTSQGKHVGSQVLRSGTAAPANYAEARSAESRSDFIHKLRIVLKELNETEVWLDLATKSSWIDAETIGKCMNENRELFCIIAKSIKTAGGFPHK